MIPETLPGGMGSGRILEWISAWSGNGHWVQRAAEFDAKVTSHALNLLANHSATKRAEIATKTAEVGEKLLDKLLLLIATGAASKVEAAGYLNNTIDVAAGTSRALIESIDPIEAVRPAWLTPTVNNIAADLMVRINNAGAANAMNLCCTALLASRQRSLTREQLTEQLNCYLDLMRNVPYSTDSTVPSASASELIDHALQMNKFEVEKDTIGEIIILPREQAVLMTYYRNNIAHMLVLPSLMAAIVTQHRHISRDVLMEHVNVLYPMLKAELFLRWDRDELPDVIDALANEMQRQGLITLQDDELHINPAHSRTLQLLAAGARETLQRYAITFWLLSANPSINRGTLEKESRTVAQRLSVLHGINAPEFFDKAVFSSLVLTLRDEGYISDSGDAEPAETMKVYQLLAELITSDVRLTIESATQGEG